MTIMAKAAKTITTTTTAPRVAASRHDDLKAMLEARRQQLVDELHGRIRGVRAEAATRGHEGQDPGETADVDIQGDIEFALIQMKAETLNTVNDALERRAAARKSSQFAAVAISSGYTCTLIPNDPPTSLQITRTFDSGMPR